MIVLGVLACFLVGTVIVLLLLFGTGWSLDLAFSRISWIPLLALVVEGVLWKPMSRGLSYFAVVPPLLTCIASIFLAVVGATLVAAARQRGEPHEQLLRATLVASVPGLLLLACMTYGLVSTVAR